MSASGCISPEHAHYIYYDMWPFPLVNVTQTTGGGGIGKTGSHIVRLWETKRNEKKVLVLFFFSSFGIYRQPIHALARAQRKHFNYHHHAYVNLCTRTHGDAHSHFSTLSPHPEGRGQVKCCVGAVGLVFLLAGILPTSTVPLFKSH